MSDFKRPGSPVKRSPYRLRNFDGIGGPRVQILKRTNQRGWDISASFCNDVEDFNITERGTLRIHDGMTKISTTGFNSSVTGIFQITIGGLFGYGVVYDGTVAFLPLGEPLELEPWNFKDPFGMPDYIPDDWPVNLKRPDEPEDEVPLVDPSLPPSKQVCKEEWFVENSPSSLSFEMDQGGPVPDTQVWYEHVYGWWPDLSWVITTTQPYFYSSLRGWWVWEEAPCYWHSVRRYIVGSHGKDVNGNWLSADTYEGTIDSLSEAALTLLVLSAEMTISGTADFYFIVGQSTAETEAYNVSNTGAVGSTLEWSRTLTIQTALVGLVTALPASGSLLAGTNEDCDVSVDPSGLSVGDYEDTSILFTDSQGPTESKDINVYVRPFSPSDINVRVSNPNGSWDATLTVIQGPFGITCQWRGAVPGTGYYVDVLLEWAQPGWWGILRLGLGGTQIKIPEFFDMEINSAGTPVAGYGVAPQTDPPQAPSAGLPVTVTFIP